MPRRRRGRLPRLLVLVLSLTLAAGTVIAGATAWAWFDAGPDTTGEVDFDRELAIPPLAESTVDSYGRRVFELTARTGTSDLGADEPTSTWGFNGDYLGPTLRAERGEEVLVNVHNDLDEATTVHWHGMHLPAAMDGGPHQMVDPGDSWSPTWTIDQPASTLWYHPHPHGETTEHVARGLAGVFILEDPQAAALGLPREYGVDDVPVIVQDKALRGDGRLRESASLGEDLVVNGTPGPYFDVSTERVRLRLLNASTERVYDFGLDNDAAFELIASDGGLLPEPHRTDRVRLSPGERAEIVVSMDPGETRVLRSYPPELGVNFFTERFSGGGATLDLLQLRAADTLTPSPGVPATLAPANAEAAGQESDAARTRTFELQGRSINGKSMDMSRIDEVVTLGDTEIWEVTNTDGSPHNFHVHDVQFGVLTVDGREPGPELSGLKDTVYLPPDAQYRLLLTFTDYADADTPYMYHCHLLKHEDAGMMGQFVVVEPGIDVDASMSMGSHPHTGSQTH